MAVGDIVPVPGAQFEQTLASASPDVLREMIREFAQRMMDADVEVRCNAGSGEVTPERVNSRNGYRRRKWDTRAGTVELAIPKLRAGSYGGQGLVQAGAGAAGAGESLVEVDPVVGDAELGQGLALGGEVLQDGGTPGVADEFAHPGSVSFSPGSPDY